MVGAGKGGGVLEVARRRRGGGMLLLLLAANSGGLKRVTARVATPESGGCRKKSPSLRTRIRVAKMTTQYHDVFQTFCKL